MSRGKRPIWRPLAVWLVVTAAAVSSVTWLPASWALARTTNAAPIDAISNLIVGVCATGLAVALAWLWLITTATVVGVMRGAVPSNAGATRRLVLLACGVAVAAGATMPAQASDSDTAQMLSGLPLPDRAVSQTHDPNRADARTGPERSDADRTEKSAETAATSGADAQATADAGSNAAPGSDAEPYVVRPGDSLWAIAQQHPDAGSDVNERWQEIWAANRDVVGEDPDLILPGQELRITDTRSDGSTDQDSTENQQDGER